ncbi:dephospho-CoA kinase CoaE [Streptococcus equi subsp. zooepidemicus Sz105]|uniref:dephospho-CoA kinase n=1 Tax=Streptococcus equi TaxID=1336 RepID=UPI0005B849C2|nr:dephospho-CoA kinase [Streptococcus equi]KIS12283.1 dephospho-CoA kinase CoaE [Streptococcus equi subsp. zooepidemicus Sz105]MDI5988923.1 dephospho-CoA kinase [Streptococcus equi subsp. zooepidemicus]HEL0559351.1 dephospho-CoA kinase [Streptococcus equi subsp. zooepidemicus]HEL0585846.1 dephospho-CoA kinase [Streptococcus equi subsp. zooepidemicus]HEL0608943.1 dephospho-CoA kinase [Streptococcus equi subsp. zooepidemicus]
MSKIIGITGGIASGKSTAVALIRQAGYQVIDADQVVHELQAKGGRLYQVLLETFGQDILLPSGELDRPKLAELLFAHSENMAKSSQQQNAIIREALATKKEQLAQTEDIFFMDLPLLVELGYQDWFDAIWLLYVDDNTQLKRLMERNQLTELAAKQRIASQLPMSQKKVYADVVIDNNGDLQALEVQLKKALQTLEV